jgi:hypothetical protein
MRPGDKPGDRYEVLSLCRPPSGSEDAGFLARQTRAGMTNKERGAFSCHPRVVEPALTRLQRRAKGPTASLLSLLFLLVAQALAWVPAFAQSSIGTNQGISRSSLTSGGTVTGITPPIDLSISGSGALTLAHSGQASCTSSNTPCTVTAGILIGDATGGNIQFNLPTTNNTNNPISACKIDSTANTVTLHRNGTDTISSAATDYVLSTQHQCVLLVDTAAGNWSVRSERWAPGNMPAAEISGTALTAANNLSEVNAATARSNLGLGTIATYNYPLEIAQGGNGCGLATTFALRDQSPVQGETCGFTDAASCAFGQAVTGGGSFFCYATYISGTYPIDVWKPGGNGQGTGNFNHAITSGVVNLAVTSTTGTGPSVDWYSGTLTANSTYTLPACASSSCVDNDIIGVTAVQGASAYSVAFATSAFGGIEGPACPTLGSTAGNQETWQFKFNAVRASWVSFCGGTVPAQPSGPANGILWTAKNLTVSNSPYTILGTDSEFNVDASGGAVTLDLPACTAANAGKEYLAHKVDSSANMLTFAATGADTIDSFATIGISSQYSNAMVICSATAGSWLRGHIIDMAGDVTGRNSVNTVAKINGDPLSTPPNIPNAQWLTSGTSYTVPAGCNLLTFQICAGGGGGGGATTGGATVCTGAGGGSGACSTFIIPSPAASYTYALGAAGAAGTNGTTPAAGGNGTASTLTVGSKTATLNFGSGGGTNNAACSSAPAGGAQGTGSSGTVFGNLASNYPTFAGSAGVAGSATATAALGGSTGNCGGNGGTVSAGGASVLAPTTGCPGYAVATCYGATVY